MSAGKAGFDHHAIAGGEGLDPRPNRDHFARGFVSQHDRIMRGELTDAPVLVPVQIAAANANRPNPDGDFTMARIGRLRHFAFFKCARGDELDGSHDETSSIARSLRCGFYCTIFAVTTRISASSEPLKFDFPTTIFWP